MSDNESSVGNERVVRVLEAAEVLSSPADVVDVDPSRWLEQPTDMLGTVEVDGVRLKIAALTEEETQRYLKMNRKPDPRNPTAPPQLDPMAFRLAIIAASLNKANPSAVAIMPNQLITRKTGSLTKIQDAIMALSGMEGPAINSAFFG